jgi:hypothetical protein
MPRIPLTRRGFLSRASAAAFASVGAAAAFGRRRADAHVKPAPCRVRCEPISKTGCACGGNLYRCSGCGTTYHACIDGQPFAWFCQRRSC